MYTYYYEAYSQTMSENLRLDDTYILLSWVATILLAVLAFALTLFAAIAIKRARPLGVIVALAQPIGIVAATNVVLSYAKVDLSVLNLRVTSTVSQSDAMTKLYTKMGEVFIEKVFPQMIENYFWSAVLGIVTIITIVYFILLFKPAGKACAIIAMILTTVRLFFINPIEMFSVLLNSPSQTIQGLWDVVFRFILILPLLLIAIQGIVNLVSNAKAKKAAAAEAAAAAVVAEAVATEAEAANVVIETAEAETADAVAEAADAEPTANE